MVLLERLYRSAPPGLTEMLQIREEVLKQKSQNLNEEIANHFWRNHFLIFLSKHVFEHIENNLEQEVISPEEHLYVGVYVLERILNRVIQKDEQNKYMNDFVNALIEKFIPSQFKFPPDIDYEEKAPFLHMVDTFQEALKKIRESEDIIYKKAYEGYIKQLVEWDAGNVYEKYNFLYGLCKEILSPNFKEQECFFCPSDDTGIEWCNELSDDANPAFCKKKGPSFSWLFTPFPCGKEGYHTCPNDDMCAHESTGINQHKLSYDSHQMSNCTSFGERMRQYKYFEDLGEHLSDKGKQLLSGFAESFKKMLDNGGSR